MFLSHILTLAAVLLKMAPETKALLVNSRGFGPEVEPEVKVMRATLLALKVFLGTRPLCFSASFTILVLPTPAPSRVEEPLKLMICLIVLASFLRVLMRFSVFS